MSAFTTWIWGEEGERSEGSDIEFARREGWDTPKYLAKIHSNDDQFLGWMIALIVFVTLTVVFSLVVGLTGDNSLPAVPKLHPDLGGLGRDAIAVPRPGGAGVPRPLTTAEKFAQTQQSLLYAPRRRDRLGAMLRGLKKSGREFNIVINT